VKEGSPEPIFRDITDTARWVAVYRAREAERLPESTKEQGARPWSGICLLHRVAR
jgi:hypothetical protein